MSGDVQVRFCESAPELRDPRATRHVACFRHCEDAERFSRALKEGLGSSDWKCT